MPPPPVRLELLASPFTLGPLRLRNRMCMPALHLGYAAEGEVTDRLVAFYRERARGGVAMITVGGCTVEPAAGGPSMIALHDDRFLPGLERLTDAIHREGALALVQLYHAGKYVSSRSIGQRAVSASAVRSKLTGETPRALTLEEILSIEERYELAAARAIQAGFDGVEVLASAGYLICQFLSPTTNRRDDEYGGPLEQRVRFGREVLQHVRRAIGRERALLVRVAGADFVSGGHGIDESVEVCRLFEPAGIDGFNVTGGWHETSVPQLTMGVPRGAFLYLARAIREAVRAPVLASNRLGDPRVAERALRDGMADLINLGRPLLADPDLPRKVLDGRADRVVHCVACNQGCLDRVFEEQPVSCLVNPRAGREDLPPCEPAASAKRVLVVGGGPAGLMAAVTAARRGHQVTLLEAAPQLGGQLLLAGAPPRGELLTLVVGLAREASLEGVELCLGEDATPGVVRAHRPDVLVLACGARPRRPAIPGADLPLVAPAWEVLAGRCRPGPRVVILGGGPVGVHTALVLAGRGAPESETLRFLLLTEAVDPRELRQLGLRGTHRVTLVEQAKQIGADLGKTTRWTLMRELKAGSVDLRNQTCARRITEEGLWVAPAGQDGRAEPPEELIPADTVVLAAGSESVRFPVEELPPDLNVVVVGDAQNPRRAFEAIHEGFAAGIAI